MSNAVRTPDCYCNGHPTVQCCNGHPTVTAMDYQCSMLSGHPSVAAMATQLLLQWITSVYTGPCFKRLITSVQGCSPRTPDCCYNELLMSNAVRTPDCCYNELLMSNAVRTPDLFGRGCYSVKQSAILPSCSDNILIVSSIVGRLVDERRPPRTLLARNDIVAQTSSSFSPPGKN